MFWTGEEIGLGVMIGVADLEPVDKESVGKARVRSGKGRWASRKGEDEKGGLGAMRIYPLLGRPQDSLLPVRPDDG